MVSSTAESAASAGRPAPLWRRLAAAVYDGLLLLGLWMGVLLIDTLLRDALDLARNWAVLRALLLAAGFAFFGWFWTHGGQTLGMRSWRLLLLSRNGTRIGWPTAALRYALQMLMWSVCLIPLLTLSPKLLGMIGLPLSIGSAVFVLMAWLMQARDHRRRAPHDWLSGSYMVMQDGSA